MKAWASVGYSYGAAILAELLPPDSPPAYERAQETGWRSICRVGLVMCDGGSEVVLPGSTSDTLSSRTSFFLRLAKLRTARTPTLESQAQSRIGASYERGAAGTTPFHAAELLAVTFEAGT